MFGVVILAGIFNHPSSLWTVWSHGSMEISCRCTFRSYKCLEKAAAWSSCVWIIGCWLSSTFHSSVMLMWMMFLLHVLLLGTCTSYDLCATSLSAFSLCGHPGLFFICDLWSCFHSDVWPYQRSGSDFHFAYLVAFVPLVCAVYPWQYLHQIES